MISVICLATGTVISKSSKLIFGYLQFTGNVTAFISHLSMNKPVHSFATVNKDGRHDSSQ